MPTSVISSLICGRFRRCNDAIPHWPVLTRGVRLYSPGRQRQGTGMIDTVTKPKTKVKTKTERPRLHKVILVNDDYTPREFVVTVLKAEFRMTEDQAHKVMITAHRLEIGRASCRER